jgi:hypothetical protein
MSLGTSNRDGGKTSESGHLRALAKLVDGDVLEGLAVSQRSAGANMSVDVAIGDAFVRRSDGSYAHPVFNDAVYNQVISAADGSNPRRDIVVIYVDYAQAPSTAVSNNTNGVVKIKVVNGTPAGSPTDPSDATIQSSVGAGNPWTKLSRVRVPASQTSITNSLIDDLRSLITHKSNTVTTASIQDNAVTTAKIPTNAITNTKLATTAIKLGYAQLTSNFTTTTNSLITGLSVAITMPAGGRSIKVTFFSLAFSNAASPTNTDVTIEENGTEIARGRVTSGGANYASPGMVMAVRTPASGASVTYTARLYNIGGSTAQSQGSANSPQFILVEII